jgi:thiamine biosynthesis lipoprotein
MIDLRAANTVHHFDHQAMNTIFSLRINHPDRSHSLLAAGACFRGLDLLEACLSRYRDDSDISRINAMEQGDTLFIQEETYSCLQLAIQAGCQTGGLFDITLGAQIEHRKREEEGPPPPVRGKISLAPDRPMVICEEPGRQLDLGGIGKGFGLDRMAGTLQEHGIDSALLSCSGSTLLAFGPESWPVVLRGDHDQRPLELCQQALSASGTGFQGAHVLHPEDRNHAYRFARVWVVAQRAAVADAFSTACLVMSEEELQEFRRLVPELQQCFAQSTADPQLRSL